MSPSIARATSPPPAAGRRRRGRRAGRTSRRRGDARGCGRGCTAWAVGEPPCRAIAEQQARRDLGRDRRRQVVGDGDRAAPPAGWSRSPRRIRDDPGPDVADVGGARGQQLVVEGREDLGGGIGGGPDGRGRRLARARPARRRRRRATGSAAISACASKIPASSSRPVPRSPLGERLELRGGGIGGGRGSPAPGSSSTGRRPGRLAGGALVVPPGRADRDRPARPRTPARRRSAPSFERLPEAALDELPERRDRRFLVLALGDDADGVALGGLAAREDGQRVLGVDGRSTAGRGSRS